MHRQRVGRLANEPKLERHYVLDEVAMLQALRVVLGLPKRPTSGREARV